MRKQGGMHVSLSAFVTTDWEGARGLYQQRRIYLCYGDCSDQIKVVGFSNFISNSIVMKAILAVTLSVKDYSLPLMLAD